MILFPHPSRPGYSLCKRQKKNIINRKKDMQTKKQPRKCNMQKRL